jgi:hypothetical protein
MAEFLIRITDKPGATSNNLRSRAGDVITIQPDGWVWSEKELTSNFWRIVRIPGLKVDAANDWLDSKFSLTELENDGSPKLLARRKNYIDFSLLPAAIKANLVDTRSSSYIDISKHTTLTAVRKLRS